MGIVSPDTILITPQILNLISEIDIFKGSWQQGIPLTSAKFLALKKVATIESIGSSTRIEGAKLTDREIEVLLLQINKKTLETRDEQEVVGYSYVCEEIYAHYVSMPLSENLIKHLHVLLLKYSTKDTRHRGEYKKIPIQIEAFDELGKHIGVIFETASPFQTPIQMEALIAWATQEFKERNLHPLIVIGIFVVLFLAIHPFQDGNGRLSRLLTTLLLLKNGYTYVPYSSLESIIEANKESYYLALQKTQKTWQSGKVDRNPWLVFFFECLQRQKRHLETKLDREKMGLQELSPLSEEILGLLKAHGKLGISEITKMTKANRNTLKKTLATLVKNRAITLVGQGKASRYISY